MRQIHSGSFVAWQNEEKDKPTQPKLPALPPDERFVAVRSHGSAMVALNEQGQLLLSTPGRPPCMLSAEEAFDLLDFLYTHRTFLTACSLAHLERQE